MDSDIIEEVRENNSRDREGRRTIDEKYISETSTEEEIIHEIDPSRSQAILLWDERIQIHNLKSKERLSSSSRDESLRTTFAAGTRTAQDIDFSINIESGELNIEGRKFHLAKNGKASDENVPVESITVDLPNVFRVESRLCYTFARHYGVGRVLISRFSKGGISWTVTSLISQ